MDIATALDALSTQGFFIWDDFLSPDEIKLIRSDFEQIRSTGQFKRAGIGKASDHHVNDEIRKDETFWLEPLHLSEAQALFWNRLEALKNQINESLFLGLWALNGHYSYYPVSGHYHAHLDRFSKDDTRTISMVLYFNENWKKEDGGELRLHDSAHPDGIKDVSPIGGRLICFLSSKVLHEVLITHQPRLSFAGWWNRRPQT
jgi:SM-20-related protein